MTPPTPTPGGGAPDSPTRRRPVPSVLIGGVEFLLPRRWAR